MVVAIVQARMASRRFPGKVMREVGGRPLIGHLLRRLSTAQRVEKIVVASSANPENKPLLRYAESLGVDCWADPGEEGDVLGRYVRAANEFDADVVVRITGDCVLIDPRIVDRVIGALEHKEFATNVLYRTYAKGMDTEVMTQACLGKLDSLCTDDRREHVTLYLYRNAHLFDIENVFDSEQHSEIIACVDYPEDFRRIEQVLLWNPLASYREVIRYMKGLHESEAHRVSREYGGPAGSH